MTGFKKRHDDGRSFPLDSAGVNLSSFTNVANQDAARTATMSDNAGKIDDIDISENLKGLTPRQLWLLEHQITAFWHGFGIANGLVVPKDAIKIRRFPKGTPREQYYIDAEYMRQVLMEYLKWLQDYKKGWNYPDSDFEQREFPNGFASFLAHEKATHWNSRKDILKMINLLQDNAK